MSELVSDEEAQPQRQEARGISPLVYELFVLGELMVRSQHGYRLREQAGRVLGPARSLSWGVLYPLIRRLEQVGMTISKLEKRRKTFPATEAGPARRIYTITDTGRQRFFELMLHEVEYRRDTPEFFLIKLSKLQFLTPVQQIGIIQWYRRYVAELSQYYQEERRTMLNNEEVGEGERSDIVRLVDYRQHTLQAELLWLDSVVASGTVAQLTVRGRKSGQPYTIPVAILERNGKRYIVASFGIVNWVQNLRVMGQATITRELHSEAIKLVELTPTEAAPILKESLMKGTSLVRRCFKVTPTSPLQEFEREALEHPVFQLREV